ncbi:hypothetical protein CNBB3790 [Cryptococcus deneoformans B-3501A]|uniref:hypothetical protein n=1 Tax=Cryptococcus deneoformans (strain B-3501A) TaxID=283643 RepID=UPI000042E28B|nr:hypothetical protein CNBB3790 [Cryptococcus neoformans var. neoformans B-3501A]EAL22501.1 hypothetical protein CNBB3790 [Cryptococcus neoformans var. neoformans B-3501A]
MDRPFICGNSVQQISVHQSCLLIFLISKACIHHRLSSRLCRPWNTNPARYDKSARWTGQDRNDKLYLRSILPIGVLFSGSLILSNTAYLTLSVSFIQMLKAFTPVAILLISAAFKLQVLNSRLILIVLLISTGCVLAAYGELYFEMFGFICQVSAVAPPRHDSDSPPRPQDGPTRVTLLLRSCMRHYKCFLHTLHRGFCAFPTFFTRRAFDYAFKCSCGLWTQRRGCVFDRCSRRFGAYSGWYLQRYSADIIKLYLFWKSYHPYSDFWVFFGPCWTDGL